MKKVVLVFCCLLIISISFCGCGYSEKFLNMKDDGWFDDLILENELLERNSFTVYLDDVSELEAVYIGKEIEKVTNVSQVEFISKDEALEKYKDVLGEKFEDLQDDNPLPHSYRVVLTDLSLYEQTMDKILEIDGVDSVSY